MFFRSKMSGGCDWIIAGLGNPGPKYEATRHNIGFRALDSLAKRLGADVKTSKYEALCGFADAKNEAGERVRVLLMKPLTFMNLSGRAVAAAARFYKIPPERIIIIFDDVTLAPGRLRVRASGSAGGHNGIKSLISELGSDAFPRVKIGVGENQYPDLVDWVLGKPSDEDAKHIAGACDAAGDAALYYIANGAQATAGKFNGLSF